MLLMPNQPDMALKVANNLQGGADGELKIAAALASVGKTSEALKHFEHLAAYAQQNNNPAALAPIMKTILDLRIAEQMRKRKEHAIGIPWTTFCKNARAKSV